jgi:putative transposase
VPWLTSGPVPFPKNWSARVDHAQTPAELEALQRSLARGATFGDAPWQTRTANALGLQSAMRPPWRPKKESIA